MAGSMDYGSGEPISQINMIPMIDVMLVLLIIFMVAAPMLQQGVDVNLPTATTAPLSGSSEQVVLSVNKNGELFIGKDNPLSLAELPERIKAIMQLRPEDQQKVYIQADTDLDYGSVMQVMASLHQSGIYQIGLVSSPHPDPVEEKKKRS